MTSLDVRPVDYRELMKKVEQVVADMEQEGEVGATIHSVVAGIIDKFRGELGLSGGRLYRRRDDDYVLEATFGDAKEVPHGFRVPGSYPPIEHLLEEGTVYMDLEDPGVDRDLERTLGVQSFAAVDVGDGEYVLAFDVAPGYHRDDVLFSLGILRHSINQKLRRERMAGIFEEARKIQASILPRRVPEYGSFDIFGSSESMDAVGGDFYDYIPLTDKILGLAIADVSGHGLPAALQVRDIYMGLRMGLARDFKIVRTVERMNNIIHKSTLTSRFVSMFYGELEINGVFIYVNAGHPPPYHIAVDGAIRALEEGGPVLGPLWNQSYQRGFVIMKPGDLLVFYTDGIVEAQGRDEQGHPSGEFGVDRLLDVARTHQGERAKSVVEAIFKSVEEFTGGADPEDDRTVMVVSHPVYDFSSTQTLVLPRLR